MADKEIHAFSDKSVVPGEDLLFSLIGHKKIYWQTILRTVSESHKNITWGWNYYNDGKQWLFKLVQKQKTILWGAVLSNGSFRITFYFNDKAESAILSGDIPEKQKMEFMNGKRYGKIRDISLLVGSYEDVETVLKLAALKVELK
jgi:ABC-type uncharacterized transport system YnjBCD substrate-binding protein